LKWSSRYFLPVVFWVALLLRVGVVLVHPVTDLPDSRDYDALAKEIVHGQPYQVTDVYGQRVVASRMPGYPVLMAAVYGFDHERPVGVLFVQALLGFGCVMLACLLARPVSPLVEVIAAVLVALDPLGILFSASLLSETAFTFALLLTLVLILEVPQVRRGALLFLCVGILSAICVYLRASALWLVLLLPAVVLIRCPRRGMALIVLNAVVVAAALFPWVARNHTLLGMSYTRLTSLEGISLYEAVYPEATGGPRQDKIALPAEMAGMNEAQRDAEWGRRAWQFIREDPGRIGRLAVVKFGRLWSPWLNAVEYKNPVVNAGLTLWHVPIYILALIGVFQRRIPVEVRLALLLPILYFSMVHSLFLGSVRYRVPVMPLVYVLAAVGLAAILERRQAKDERRKMDERPTFNVERPMSNEERPKMEG
jgi:hypothetical protein